MKLLLFDIDGTLLRGHGRGKRALLEAMQSTLQAQGLASAFIDAVSDTSANNTKKPGIAGKTDLQFVYECLEPEIASETIRELIPQIFAEHTIRLREYYTVSDGVELLPGVRELLQAVQELYETRASCLPAVLTGNIKAGARIKLGLFGLESYFALGAYGDEGRVRRELPPVAVGRARSLTGREFRGQDIVIIGDTPNDIDCGRPLRARTLAVTTGPYSRKELAEHNPDAIFDSLENTEQVLQTIFAE